MKGLILRFLFFTGLIGLFRWVNRKSVIILSVHGVMDHGASSTWVPLRDQLQLKIFRDQIALINRYYNFVPLEAAVAMIRGEERIIPNSVAITFDDGYRNNLTHALPILRSLNIKPAFFIPTAYIGSARPFWFDRVDYALQYIDDDFCSFVNSREFRFVAHDRNQLRVTYSNLRKSAKLTTANDTEFQRFFDELAEALESASGRRLSDIQAKDDWTATLTEDDIEHLAREELATIGSHTDGHMRLTNISVQAQDSELRESKNRLSKLIGAECRHFCYPNGDHNGNVANQVRMAGYQSAVTTETGVNRCGDDPYRLKRIHLPTHNNKYKLLATLSGLRFSRS